MAKNKQQNRRRRSRHGVKPKQSPPVEVGYWVVAFLDILGYRDECLAKFDFFPPGEEERHPDAQAFFVRAVHLRRRLLGLMQQMVQPPSFGPPPAVLAQLPVQAKEAYRQFQQMQLITSPGPDHIVLACCLAPSDSHFPMTAVHTLISAAAAASLFQLALGDDDPDDTLPLRGGIDIGFGGFVLPERFLYSPALANAYHLESKVAEVPRTVAGTRFFEFLHLQAFGDERSPTAELSRQMANQVASMFFKDGKDQDGTKTLDFFGEACRDNLPPEIVREFGPKAWAYATAAYDKAKASKPPKVVDKYAWLVEYMEPRLHLWT